MPRKTSTPTPYVPLGRPVVKRQTGAFAVVVMLIVAIVSGTAYLVRTAHAPEPVPAMVVDAPSGVSQSHGVARGREGAPVTVVVYHDFACATCAEFETRHGDRLAAAMKAGKVRLETRVFAALDRHSATRYSTRAANTYLSLLDRSGVRVAEKFRFFALASLQAGDVDGTEFTDDELRDIAKTAGAKKVERVGVRADQEKLRFKAWLDDAADAAARAEVTQTPTVLVNDVRIDDPLEELWPVVKAELEQR